MEQLHCRDKQNCKDGNKQREGNGPLGTAGIESDGVQKHGAMEEQSDGKAKESDGVSETGRRGAKEVSQKESGTADPGEEPEPSSDNEE